MTNPLFPTALALAIASSSAPAQAACFFSCRPGEDHARAVVANLITQKYHAPYRLLDFETIRTADFDMIAGEMRGFEIFFKATVEFPQGVNLDCAPAAPARPSDCSDDPYFSLIRDTRPLPGRQYVEPGGRRSFDEDLRFAERKGGWKGPDGQIYQP